MAKRKVELEWNVLIYDRINDTISPCNILWRYNEDIYKEYKKGKIKNIQDLRNFLKTEFMYRYWSKYEYEIAVGGLNSKYPKEFDKVDAWTQISMNFDRIIEYINWKMQLDLK